MPEASAALARGVAHLRGLQDPAGWWKGELETNVTMDAEDLLLREFLGIRKEQETVEAARWIRSKQRDDGSWATFHGGPADLSTSTEAWIALRLAGDDPQAPHMAAAAELVKHLGGVERTRVFTRIWLALFGLWSWDELPVMPPELFLLPRWAPLNIYNWGCWARQTVVPLTVVAAARPIRPVPFGVAELQHRCIRVKPSAAAQLGDPVRAARQGPPGLSATAGPAAPRAGHPPGARLDRGAPGGGRLVGWHPATVGLLAARSAPVRLPDGPSGNAGRSGGARRVRRP